jgi:hypothetical protein
MHDAMMIDADFGCRPSSEVGAASDCKPACVYYVCFTRPSKKPSSGQSSFEAVAVSSLIHLDSSSRQDRPPR